MKERPIIFSTDMVKAILEGRKTQTRRVIRLRNTKRIREKGWSLMPIDILPMPSEPAWAALMYKGKTTDENRGCVIKCPYGVPGDKLWVRETWGNSLFDDGHVFRADYPEGGTYDKAQKWKLSIHMPKKYSRITLEIKDVRVERVQDITERDAYAEGISLDPNMPHPIQWFRDLWDSLNEKRGYGWDVNPFCWVIEFERIKP